MLDNQSYNEFAQGILDGREYLFPLAPGAPLGFPLINYNENPADDYFGLVGSDVETVQISECFPANTQIQLSDGTSKAIADIAVLDEVASFHPDQFAGRGGLASQKVVRLFENITDVWVKLSNGIVVTPGHHFLDNKGNFRTG